MIAALLVGGGAAPAWAQQSSSKSSGSSKNLKQLAKDSEELLDENVAAVSGPQKLERAQNKIEQSKKILKNTRALLKKARSKEKDIVKINCINDKLAAIKGFLKVSEQSYVKLKEAVDSGDKEAANHHYKLIAVSAQKIKKLDKEAGLCVGEVQRYAEGTVVEMNVENKLPDDPEYLTQEPTETGTLPELTPIQ
ncbi:MAG: hypothetical protein ABEN55_11015 [Bradymonadaceae bacterium]